VAYERVKPPYLFVCSSPIVLSFLLALYKAKLNFINFESIQAIDLYGQWLKKATDKYNYEILN
jgi:hypothetical protein